MELTPHEISTLEIFTSDVGAYDTVRTIAKAYIERQRDFFVRNLAVKTDHTNEEIGAKLRAFDEAGRMVDGIFSEVSQYKKKVVIEERNPAR